MDAAGVRREMFDMENRILHFGDGSVQFPAFWRCTVVREAVWFDHQRMERILRISPAEYCFPLGNSSLYVPERPFWHVGNGFIECGSVDCRYRRLCGNGFLVAVSVCSSEPADVSGARHPAERTAGSGGEQSMESRCYLTRHYDFCVVVYFTDRTYSMPG